MKLEVGQFVRTKDGKIGKYFGEKAYESNKICIWTETTKEGIKVTPIIDKNTIVKASYNIIDILEEGDILVDDTNRKSEVLLIDNELMIRNTGLIYDNNYYLPIKSIAIKSVITHEQIEQISYKIKESR